MTRAPAMLLVLLLPACGGVRDAWDGLPAPGTGPSPAAAPVAAAPVATPYPACIPGRLTEEGRYCRTLRGEDGALYALAGPLRGFGPGDSVCVCGYIPAEQFCRQGTTFMVSEIDTTCAAIR